mgnify:CR=1 FL=1
MLCDEVEAMDRPRVSAPEQDPDGAAMEQVMALLGRGGELYAETLPGFAPPTPTPPISE